jgi:hypothetical protein
VVVSSVTIHGNRVDPVGGLGAGGADLDGVTGELPQPTGGHLGPARIVHADEQNAWLVGCLVRHVMSLPPKS